MDKLNIIKHWVNKSPSQTLLCALFIFYIATDIRMPLQLAEVIDNIYGKAIIIVLYGILSMYSSTILNVLGLIVAYKLITNASERTGTTAIDKYYPSETKKWSPYTPQHQFPYTLEQEVVKKMTNTKFNTSYVKAPYKPVLEDTYNAAKINATN